MNTSNSSPSPPTTAITDVRIFNGYTLTPPSTVILKDGLISSISETPPSSQSATTINAAGKTLLPSLIESHCHVSTVAHLHLCLKYGITTVLEMGSPMPDAVSSLKASISSLKGSSSLPSLFSADLPATAPGTTHAKLMSLPAHEMPTSPSEGVQFVGARLARGADYIKAITDSPGMDQATLNSIVAQAKQNGMFCQVHAAKHAAYLMAVKAGASVVHHVPMDSPLTEQDVWARDVQFGDVQVGGEGIGGSVNRSAGLVSGFAACPTLVAMKAINNGLFGGIPERYENARKSVGVLRDAGVPILAGSDANSAKIPGLPDVEFGAALLTELGLLKDAGLSDLEVLRSVTVVPARVFGLKDRGEVRVGMRADLLLVEGDPTADIECVRKVEGIWLGGVMFKPEDIKDA